MVVLKGYAVLEGEKVVPQFKHQLAYFIKHDVIATGWKGGSSGKKVGQERSALGNYTDVIFKMA